MISRIATYGQSSASLAATLKVQAKLADQQTQTSSGLKSTTYGGLGKDSSSVLRLQSQSSQLTAENSAASTATAIANASYSALGSIADLASTIQSQLASMMSGASSDSDTVTAYVTDWLSDLEALLNSKSGDTYLFGGTATSTAPVDFSDADYDPTVDTSASDTSYYQGSSSVRTLTTADGQTISLSVTADSSAFEELARALKMVLASPTDSTVISSAYDMVSDAVTSVGTLQEKVSIQAASLSDLTDRNTAKIDSIDTLVSNLKDADLSETAILSTQYETQLEAMYSMISSLSKLSLSKYL
ncbi:MAG: flagellin [Caulobacter sp.]